MARERSSSDVTRSRVLGVAATLFAEEGFAGTSMRDIATALGITKAAIYYHFESKEQLLDAVLEDVAARFEAALASHADGAQVHTVLSAFLDALMETAPILAFLLHEPATTRRHVGHPAFHALRDRMVEVLAGPRAGKVRTVRARCALGALQFGYIATAKGDAPCNPDGREQVHGPTFRDITPAERKAILAAAVAALG